MSMSIVNMGMRLLQPSDQYDGAYSESNNDDAHDAQNGGQGNTNGSNGGGGGSGNDAYEFIAFLLWYVFLVLCCVIPTCCAYRRRRQVEARMAQQQTNMDRWQATNMFIVSSGGFRNQNNEESLQAHRTKYLQQELKATTMMVSQNDIEGNLPATFEEASKSWVKGRIKSLHDEKDEKDDEMVQEADATITATAVTPAASASATATEADTLGYDVEEVENAGSLQLPAEYTNGGRCIPAVCTICLCPYENGELVSWSPDAKCQHAFHKDCIIAWLAKKDEPKCPICRQDFCVLNDVPEMTGAGHHNNNGNTEHPTATPYNFSHSLSRALALSRLEAAAMEQHNNNNDSRNGVVGFSMSSTQIRRSVADEEMGGEAIEMGAAPETTTSAPEYTGSTDTAGSRAASGSPDNV